MCAKQIVYLKFMWCRENNVSITDSLLFVLKAKMVENIYFFFLSSVNLFICVAPGTHTLT